MGPSEGETAKSSRRHLVAAPRRWGGRRRRGLALVAALIGAAQAVAGSPPSLNLTIQFRVIEAPSAADAPDDPPPARGATLSTRRGASAAPQVQSLQVLNGHPGTLSLSHAAPIQWVQSAGIAHASAAASGARPRAAAAEVVNALTWIETGQRLAFTPSWPGGAQPVRVEIELDVSQAAATSGGELPATQRREARTTVRAALGRWTTFARVGEAAGADADAGSTWSTAVAPGGSARWFQVRVLAP